MGNVEKKKRKHIYRYSETLRISPRNKHWESVILKYSTTSIRSMPDEILLKIFSLLPAADLFYNVMKVCRRWQGLACDPTLWKRIHAGPEVPTNVLCKWLDLATKLKHLTIEKRSDASQIIEKVSSVNTGLLTIKVLYCKGSQKRANVLSLPLCRLLRKCRYLKRIAMTGTGFSSCQFVRMLITVGNAANSRTANRRRLNFVGNLNAKQMRAFLRSRRDDKHGTVKSESLQVYGVGQDGTMKLLDPAKLETLLIPS